MCCRCYIEYLKDEELKKYYDEIADKDNLKIEGEIYPTDNMIVLSPNKNMVIRPFKMKWGYTVNKLNIFNTRVENCENNIFKDGIRNRRCIIPVLNYFEWKDKVKYEIKDESNITYLLGVYRLENGKPVFSIMTKEASPEMKYIHDRMPIAIKKSDIETWIKNRDNRYDVINNSINVFNYKEI